MSITAVDVQQIKEMISDLISKKAWNPMLGVGAFITMEFGSELPYKKGYGSFVGLLL